MAPTTRQRTQRALAACRTTPAARSGVSSNLRTDGGDEKRSAGAGTVGSGRGAGGRSSGGRPGVSVIGLLGRRGGGGSLDAAGGAARRYHARLAQRDR